MWCKKKLHFIENCMYHTAEFPKSMHTVLCIVLVIVGYPDRFLSVFIRDETGSPGTLNRVVFLHVRADYGYLRPMKVKIPASKHKQRFRFRQSIS